MYLIIFSVLFVLAVFGKKQILLDGILYATLCIAMAMISGKVKYDLKFDILYENRKSEENGDEYNELINQLQFCNWINC